MNNSDFLRTMFAGYDQIAAEARPRGITEYAPGMPLDGSRPDLQQQFQGLARLPQLRQPHLSNVPYAPPDERTKLERGLDEFWDMSQVYGGGSSAGAAEGILGQLSPFNMATAGIAGAGDIGAAAIRAAEGRTRPLEDAITGAAIALPAAAKPVLKRVAKSPAVKKGVKGLLGAAFPENALAVGAKANVFGPNEITTAEGKHLVVDTSGHYIESPFPLTNDQGSNLRSQAVRNAEPGKRSEWMQQQLQSGQYLPDNSNQWIEDGVLDRAGAELQSALPKPEAPLSLGAPAAVRPIVRKAKGPLRRAFKTAEQLAESDAENAAISATRPNAPPSSGLIGAAPDRSQYTLLRHRAPRGDSARFKTLEGKIDTDPASSEELMQLARDGEEVGRKWYNTEDLRGRFIEELGQDAGDDAWREFMWQVGATSTGSKVLPNIKNASHYYVQGQERLAKIADDLMAGKIDPPEGYGHKMQKSQARNAANYASGGWGPGADPRLNAKPRGFTQSLLGNETNIAADKHFMRLMGQISDDPQFLHGSAEISQELYDTLTKKYGKKVTPFLSRSEINNAKKQPTGKVRINFNAKKAAKEGPKDLYEFIKGEASVWDDMPNENEYAAFERVVGKLAKKMDMTPAQFQASLWMGAARRTNVAPSSLDTFENLFNQRLAQTAAERGKSADEVFKNFVHRKEALTIPLGLLGGAELLNQQD